MKINLRWGRLEGIKRFYNFGALQELQTLVMRLLKLNHSIVAKLIVLNKIDAFITQIIFMLIITNKTQIIVLYIDE